MYWNNRKVYTGKKGGKYVMVKGNKRYVPKGKKLTQRKTTSRRNRFGAPVLLGAAKTAFEQQTKKRDAEQKAAHAAAMREFEEHMVPVVVLFDLTTELRRAAFVLGVRSHHPLLDGRTTRRPVVAAVSVPPAIDVASSMPPWE